LIASRKILEEPYKSAELVRKRIFKTLLIPEL